MPGPAWDDDDPRDAALIAANAEALVRSFTADDDAARSRPTLALVRSWHAGLYAGCHLPSSQYLGGLRGDASRPHLVGYEVGGGALQPDGAPDKLGVRSTEVHAAVHQLLGEITAALVVLDGRFPVGKRPRTVGDVDVVVSVIAAVHGEWVRVHPFAHGNSRIARLWAAWLAVRYHFPVFVTVKPSPDDVAYTRAGRSSMSRSHDSAGDHTAAANVFTHLLALAVPSKPERR